MILPAKLEKEDSIKVEFQKGRNKILPDKVHRHSIIDKIRSRIRTFLFDNNKEYTYKKTALPQLSYSQSNEFRKKYRVDVDTTIGENSSQEILSKEKKNKQQEEK